MALLWCNWFSCWAEDAEFVSDGEAPCDYDCKGCRHAEKQICDEKAD